MVGQEHSRWIFTKEDCSKNLQIENRSSSCQYWSLHGFQTWHFICDWFGCKLWLQLIQNNAWYCFQAFARRHLKSLHCLILIWADALFLDRSSIKTCRFAQDSIRNMLSRQFYGNFISHEKQIDKLLPEIYKALKPYLLLNWVSIASAVACFPQASLSLPAATAADSETLCVCARPSDPRKQSWRAAPRAWPLILPFKPSITFWNSLRRDCQMTCRGSNLDSNLNCAAWPTSCKGFIPSEITA